MISLTMLILGAIIISSVYIGLKTVIHQEFSLDNVLKKLQDIDRMAGEQEMRRRYNEDFSGSVDEFKFQQEAELLKEEQQKTFNNSLTRITNVVVLELSIILFFITIATIFITHKIAGPLYRIKFLLKEAEKGNLNVNFKLRKGDQLHDLASSLNHFLDTYRATIREISISLDEVHIKCTSLQEKTDNSTLQKELSDLKNKLKQITAKCHKISDKIT